MHNSGSDPLSFFLKRHQNRLHCATFSIRRHNYENGAVYTMISPTYILYSSSKLILERSQESTPVADSFFHLFGVQCSPDTPKNSLMSFSAGIVQPDDVLWTSGGSPFTTKLF